MKKILFFLAFSIALSACRKSDEKILENDLATIQQYLEDNNLQAESTDSGLHYIITEEGNGVFPDLSSEVTVNYRGFFPNGDTFDQSGPSGITFPLLGVIEGWQEGIPFFSEGGEGILLIPSALGYGRNGSGSIGPNEVLIFDIELIDVD